MSYHANAAHRRRNIAAAAVILAVSAGPATGQTPTPLGSSAQPLSANDLEKMAETSRKFAPKDSFDSPPVLMLYGRLFSIEQTVREASDGGCVDLPFWRYKAGTRELELIAFGGTRGFNSTVPVTCEVHNKGSYEVSNAFGAKSTIVKQSERTTEVALSKDYHPLIMSTVSMAPEEARSVTKNLKVRIEGVLTSWGQEGSLICKVERTDVDMSTVWDTTSDRCLYSGAIIRIAFIDGSDGRVIAERDF